MDLRRAASELALDDWLDWLAYWEVDRFDGIRDDLRGLALKAWQYSEENVHGVWPYVETGLDDSEIEAFLRERAANEQRPRSDQATD